MRGVLANGEQIRLGRTARGLTQEQLAAQGNCDVKTIRSAERGNRVDASTLRRLADALGESLSALVRSGDDAPGIAAQNAALYHAFQQAHNLRDLDALVASYHPDGVLVVAGAQDMPGGGERRGHAAIRQHFAEALAAFEPDPLFPDQYKLDAVDDYVFFRAEAGATVRSTGKRFVALLVQELQFRDGLIVRHTFVCDTNVIREALDDGDAVPPHST